MPINVGVQTEPRVSPPEFIISCRTHGGPATEVSWLKHITLVEGSQYNISVYIIQTSQTILDTSFNSVYDNKLFVRGRAGGEFSCSVRNNFPLITRTNKTIITGWYNNYSESKNINIFCNIIYSCRRTYQFYCCHFFLQQYTCQCHCVLGVTS